jgi:hypothetical protein
MHFFARPCLSSSPLRHIDRDLDGGHPLSDFWQGGSTLRLLCLLFRLLPDHVAEIATSPEKKCTLPPSPAQGPNRHCPIEQPTAVCPPRKLGGLQVPTAAKQPNFKHPASRPFNFSALWSRPQSLPSWAALWPPPPRGKQSLAGPTYHSPAELTRETVFFLTEVSRCSAWCLWVGKPA